MTKITEIKEDLDLQEDLARKREAYGCDGYCYGCNTDLEPGDPRRKEMCPLVDTCPETCAGEFWATAGACIALTGWILVATACLIAAFYRPAPTPMEICEETLEWYQCETLERHVEDFDKLNYIESVNGKYIYLMQTDLREYEVMIEPSEPFDVFLVRQGDEVVWSKTP